MNPRVLCYLILVIISFLIFAFALLSDFSYDIFYKARFGEAFFDMWRRIIAGDVTIGRDVLSGEIFIVNGKLIAYYLPFPALIRGLLSIFEIGEYSIPSILMSITLYSISIYFLLKEILNYLNYRESNAILYAWYPFFLLPLISLFVEASIYWEAIIWSLALFMTQAFLFLYFLRVKKPSTHYLLLLVSSFILFTRPTYAIASGVLVLILFFIDINSKNYSIRYLLSYCFFMLALLFLAYLNYSKWGSPFEFASLAQHEQLLGTERGRMAAISPSLSINRIPETLDYYFSISALNFNSHPPFIQFGGNSTPLRAYFDYKEAYYSITLLLPFHVLAGLLGGYILFRRSKYNCNSKKYFQIYFFISIIPALLMLMMISMALRYRSEFFAVLIFSSMIGIVYVQNTFSRIKIFLTAILFTLIAFVLVLTGLFTERLMFYPGVLHNPNPICTWFQAKCIPDDPFPHDFPFDDSFFLSDISWNNGIAKNWSGFFLPNTSKYSDEYKLGKFVRFPTGDTREITKVVSNGQYLNIFLNGDPLDPEKVGLPTKFVVIDKTEYNPEEGKK
jgi:hypothetical protein